MRKSLRRFIELTTRTLIINAPVFEFGALQVQDNSELEDLRTLFPGLEYIGSDMRSGKGVDRVLDLHQLDLPDASVGTAICMDSLEHVEYPRRAIAELHRVLHSDGILIISSVMNFPIHAYPNDYWRFTPEGFRSLLQGFAHAVVGFDGPADFPATIVGIGFKGRVPDLQAYEAEFFSWQQHNNRIIEHINEHGLSA